MIRAEVKNERAISAIKRLGPHAKNAKRRAMGKAAKPMVAAIKEAAPVATGATKKSIGIVRGKEVWYIGVRRGDFTVNVNTDVHKVSAKTGRELKSFTKKKITKRPADYAYIVNARTHWFDKVARANLGKLKARTTAGLYDELKKAFLAG